MDGVTVSSGARSILRALQTAAVQTRVTQDRMASGRRVNSALDNPTSFFTARALQQRAGDLNALVDRMSQAQGTLNAANNGVSSIVKLVETAKSVALAARQAPVPQATYDEIVATGGNVGGEVTGNVTGNVDTSGAFTANANGLQIQIGGSTYTVNTAGATGVGAIINAINNTVGGAVTAGLDATGKYLKLTALNSDISFSVLNSAAATALGIAGQSGTSTNLLQALPSLSGTTLTVRANGGATRSVTFGNGGAQVSRLAELVVALNGSGVAAGNDGSNLTLTVDASNQQNSLTLSGSALSALGLSGGTQYGAVNAPVPEATRTANQAQYNVILQQIDAMAADAGFNGINLLKGDTLTTTFNESGTSSLAVAGPILDTSGLSLTAASGNDFQSNAAIDLALGAIDSAMGKLRLEAGKLGSHLTTLQTRQNFTRDLMTTLERGADGLTLADTNQEGAALLALETRRGLSLTALSLSSQSAQGVLQLFR